MHKVLIVDDSKLARMAVAKAFSSLRPDWLRVEASSAEEAVSLAKASHFDVALLDFREHEKDPAFLVDFLDHLSPQGWLYYNKALDDFYHERED